MGAHASHELDNLQIGTNNRMTVKPTNRGLYNQHLHVQQIGEGNTMILYLLGGTEVSIQQPVIRRADVSKAETRIDMGHMAAEECVVEVSQNTGVWQSLQQFFNTLYARLERVYRGSVVIELEVKDANFLHCVEKAAKEGRLSEIILQFLQEEFVFETIKGQKVEITVEVRIPEGQYDEMTERLNSKKQEARKLAEDLLTSSRNEEIVQRQSVQGLEDVAVEVASLGKILNIAMVGGAALGAAALLSAAFTLGASLGLGAATVVALIAAFVLKIKKKRGATKCPGELG